MDKIHIFYYDIDGPSLAGACHPSPIFLLQSAFNLDQVTCNPPDTSDSVVSACQTHNIIQEPRLEWITNSLHSPPPQPIPITVYEHFISGSEMCHLKVACRLQLLHKDY